jgi:fused signal recognition particle receptor
MAFFLKTIDKLKGALRKTAQILNTDVRTLFIPGGRLTKRFWPSWRKNSCKRTWE